MQHSTYQALRFLFIRCELITFKLSILLAFNYSRYPCSGSIYSDQDISDILHMTQENEGELTVEVNRINFFSSTH